MNTARPTAYEQQVLREIRAWRTDSSGPLSWAVAQANKGLRGITNLAFRVPGVTWTVDNIFAELLKLVNELAQDTLWREAVFAEYRRRGHAVDCLDDIRALALSVVDATLRGVDIKYRAVTAAHGVAAGFAGMAGLIPDVVGLVALNLRAAGEYATYCGFDMTRESERAYALQILYSQARMPVQQNATKLVSLKTASVAAADLHTRKTAEQVAVSASIKRVTRGLAQRLTASKLAQIVPVAGALVGGGANALYTGRVCSAALNLYRERRLLARYPVSTLEEF